MSTVATGVVGNATCSDTFMQSIRIFCITRSHEEPYNCRKNMTHTCVCWLCCFDSFWNYTVCSCVKFYEFDWILQAQFVILFNKIKFDEVFLTSTVNSDELIDEFWQNSSETDSEATKTILFFLFSVNPPEVTANAVWLPPRPTFGCFATLKQ